MKTNMLNEIIEHKIKEVKQKREISPVKRLEKSIYFESPCVSLKKYLSDTGRSGVIAEFKRKSPSRGYINKYADVQEISLRYMQAGASALSVLTDEYFFGAKPDDLTIARRFNYCPVLRKDFITDEYQIIEAKSMGADVILLIAGILNRDNIKQFTTLAHNLGMEVLLEVHHENEIIENENTPYDVIGINNRDLISFEVNVETSFRLIEKLPENVLKISESGIDNVALIRKLKKAGFKGFLIGEFFMKHSHPAEKCRELIQQISYEN